MLGFSLRFTSNGARAYSPRVLFTQGQQGAWYDPSDLATLFQDAAGTIPVTGTGQPVGLMLDKSKGLVRGAELVPNGGFDSGTSGWVAANGTLSLVGGACRITSVGGSFAGRLQSGALSTVPGRSYALRYNMLGFSGGSPFVRVGTAAGGFENYAGSYTASAQVVFTATSTTSFVSLLAGTPDGDYADFDNISVRELPGNHATQATAASRPIFRDVGGLRYLECDGVDDGMVTGSINFTGTDKMLAVVGVRKLSDSAMNMVLELTATVGSNNGGFAVYAPVTALENNIGAGSRGSALSVITNPSGATAAPASVVATASASISGDSVSIRANGGATYTNTTDQGAGNYANAPIYLFRRGGASSPFNGLFYGAIIAGSTYSASQIASAERYLAGKSGVTL